MLKIIIWLVVCFCIGSVFYYSWLPNPDFTNEHYLPSWLVNWTNIYVNLRTAVPFFLLGFLLSTQNISKSLNNNSSSKLICSEGFYKTLGVSILLVFTVELGQFFLPNRSPDLWDVMYGIIGAISGFTLHHSLIKCYRSLISYGKQS